MTQRATILNVDAVKKALVVIASKVPSLAGQAAEVLSRPSRIARDKAAQTIIQAALETEGYLSKADRKTLVESIQEAEDDAYTIALHCRINGPQARKVESVMDSTGLDKSSVVRRMIDAYKG